MFPVLMLVVSAAAADPVWQATPADADRCIQSNVHKLIASKDSSWDIANKAVAACDAVLDQLTAARDRATAKEAGQSVPEWNSLEWRAAVTKTFWQSAVRSVDLARQHH